MTDFKQLKTNIQILGWYQLIGGIIGIGLFVFLLIEIFNANSNFEGSILLLILIELPFILSIYAGYLCIYYKSHKLLVSKINQILQVISFSIGGYAYTYYSGVYFSFGIDTTLEYILNFSFGLSAMNLEFNSQSENYIVYVNIIAFFLLLKIMKYETLIEDEEEIDLDGQTYLDEDLMR